MLKAMKLSASLTVRISIGPEEGNRLSNFLTEIGLMLIRDGSNQITQSTELKPHSVTAIILGMC